MAHPEYKLRVLSRQFLAKVLHAESTDPNLKFGPGELYRYDETTKSLGDDHFRAVSEFSAAAKDPQVIACELLISEQGVAKSGLVATYSDPASREDIRAAGWGGVLAGVHSIVDIPPTKPTGVKRK